MCLRGRDIAHTAQKRRGKHPIAGRGASTITPKIRRRIEPSAAGIGAKCTPEGLEKSVRPAGMKYL